MDRGTRALALLETGALYVDLALIDVYLPDITGTEVARAIRDRPAARTPIVFTSAYPTCQVDPPKLDGSVFVPKAYSSDELASAVRKLLPSREGAGFPGVLKPPHCGEGSH